MSEEKLQAIAEVAEELRNLPLEDVKMIRAGVEVLGIKHEMEMTKNEQNVKGN